MNLRGALIGQGASLAVELFQKVFGAFEIDVDCFSIFEDRFDLKSGEIVSASARHPRYAKDYHFCFSYISDNFHAAPLVNRWMHFFLEAGISPLEPVRLAAKDHEKVAAYEYLAHCNIPMPETLAFKKGTPIKNIVASVFRKFNNGIVIKTDGSGGRYVQLFFDLSEIEFAAELAKVCDNGALKIGLIVQAYLESKNVEGHAYHWRALVIDGRLVTLLKLTAPSPQILASNASNGGEAELLNPNVLTPQQQAIVVESCKALEIKIAGVDFIINEERLYILEVNHSPDLIAPWNLGELNHMIAIAKFARKFCRERATFDEVLVKKHLSNSFCRNL